MSDSEDSTASLGDSEELSVKNAPRDMIPAFILFPENGLEVSSFVTGKRAGHVFPDKPARLNLTKKSEILEDEARSSIQSFAASCDAERLAGGAADHKVNCSMVGPPIDF
jgi:hypothetical protein